MAHHLQTKELHGVYAENGAYFGKRVDVRIAENEGEFPAARIRLLAQ